MFVRGGAKKPLKHFEKPAPRGAGAEKFGKGTQNLVGKILTPCHKLCKNGPKSNSKIQKDC